MVGSGVHLRVELRNTAVQIPQRDLLRERRGVTIDSFMCGEFFWRGAMVAKLVLRDYGVQSSAVYQAVRRTEPHGRRMEPLRNDQEC